MKDVVDAITEITKTFSYGKELEELRATASHEIVTPKM